MRVGHLLAFSLVTVFVLAIGATPTLAQKGGKDGGKGGGGGDGDTSDPPVLPAFSYQVDFLTVDGLNRVEAVNDLGQCVGMVHPSLANAAIDTVEARAAVVIDTASGQVSYLDNLIDPEEPWDLYSAMAINNLGQIVGIGIKNGVYVARAYLLNPRSDGYDLVDLGVDGTSSSARDISQAGDVLLSIDDTWMVAMSDGSVSALPSTNRTYQGINSLGMIAGGYLEDGTAVNTGEYFYSNFDGVATPYELLPYMTKGDMPTLSESGYAFGGQWGPYQKIKGKEFGGSRVVTYDPDGFATEESIGFNINGNYEISAQVIDGVPLIAGTVGSGESSDISGKPWIRFPGYDAVVISDLMDDTQKVMLEQLNLGYPNPGESDASFMISTPRDTSGAIIHDGAPTLYGSAYRYEADGLSVFEGIYILHPVLGP